MGDERFWEGIAAEKLHNPMRIFNCPLLDFEYDPLISQSPTGDRSTRIRQIKDLEMAI